jgi:NAD(P)-dependent dehydrogenase (short-subunit alcohol dehydrogenase family)
MNNLSGKVVVLTGGGGGIGRATAELLAKQGCWGAMLRTNSGPEDPVWQEYPEKLHQANTAFLHG